MPTVMCVCVRVYRQNVCHVYVWHLFMAKKLAKADDETKHMTRTKKNKKQAEHKSPTKLKTKSAMLRYEPYLLTSKLP